MSLDKLRSAASAEMAVTIEALRESELTDDDAASLSGSPRVSVTFDRGLEPTAAYQEPPQVGRRLDAPRPVKAAGSAGGSASGGR